MPPLPFLLLLQDSASPTVTAALARYRADTHAGISCPTATEQGEVVVCALRTADRYRVPFVTATTGRDDPNARLERLLGDPVVQGITPCGEGLYTVKCGSVGVTMSTRFDGKARLVTRPLAP